MATSVDYSFGRKENSVISNISEVVQQQKMKQKFSNERGVRDIRDPTEFLEKISSLCRFGINVVPDMMFHISHAYTN